LTGSSVDLENTSAVTQAQSAIEIDFTSPSSPAPTDDGYETGSLGSASTSLSSSVRDYAVENGRRYHKFREGTYNFPNDDSEQDREDMKHSMVVNLCQRLHFAELRGGVGEGGFSGNVLDMGTGTGIWTIESEFSSLLFLFLMGGDLGGESWGIKIKRMLIGDVVGDLYPAANILGVDLSPIQPEWVPPNVKFMVDDVESPWLKPKGLLRLRPCTTYGYGY
jgi:hypothetical protein